MDTALDSIPRKKEIKENAGYPKKSEIRIAKNQLECFKTKLLSELSKILLPVSIPK